MRELVRTYAYVVTTHAQEEMEADQLSVFDLEHCVLTGKIAERQRDRRTGEWKYLVEGQIISGRKAAVICKVGPTGKLVFITAYLP
ncbi:MAG: DUF4258 domain-containing protein [Planctomycetes bacterium]|nr:DUF4258 domain-containing protein [Planctomycetota bacterium]